MSPTNTTVTEADPIASIIWDLPEPAWQRVKLLRDTKCIDGAESRRAAIATVLADHNPRLQKPIK